MLQDALPPSLRERLRPDQDSGGGGGCSTLLPPPRSGQHVLYLLRTAYRASGNPAFEVALRLATALDLPLLCLAVIEDTSLAAAPPSTLAAAWPPTDRQAAFRLEALLELQPLFAARGSVLYVHVERDGCRPAAALSLAAKASLVVSDEHFGIDPHAAVLRRVRLRTAVPTWLCDTACTVPSVFLLRGTTNALQGGNQGFLRSTAAARTVRLAPAWFPAPAPAPRVPPPTEPPTWAVDLSGGDANRLVSGISSRSSGGSGGGRSSNDGGIDSGNGDGNSGGDYDDLALDAILAAPSKRDTTVGRVTCVTRGGPSAASARWQDYVSSGGLRTYAAHRNNLLHAPNQGASRMSAYLNAGMVDPYQVAGDAQVAGAEKFLAEFAGFRESAYLWCLAHPGAYAVAAAAVPEWARNQLRSHCTAEGSSGGGGRSSSKKSGERAPTLADLEAGRSGDALWDDCQRGLLLSGELHNNARMAWGKAIPAWHEAALLCSSDRTYGGNRSGGGGTTSGTSSGTSGGTSGGGIGSVDVGSGLPAGGVREDSPLVTGPGPAKAAWPAPVRLQAALDLLRRLNDRFALDGGAPPSYGGLLWCLGWRDRPGVGGCPKERPTRVLAKRVRAGDLERRARQRLLLQDRGGSGSSSGSGSSTSTSSSNKRIIISSSSSSPPVQRAEEQWAAEGAPSAKRMRVTPRGSSGSSSNGPPTRGTIAWHFPNPKAPSSPLG